MDIITVEIKQANSCKPFSIGLELEPTFIIAAFPTVQFWLYSVNILSLDTDTHTMTSSQSYATSLRNVASCLPPPVIRVPSVSEFYGENFIERRIL